MRTILRDLKTALAELLRPTFPEDPDPESTAEDTAARTEWIRDRRLSREEVTEMRRNWEW